MCQSTGTSCTETKTCMENAGKHGPGRGSRCCTAAHSAVRRSCHKGAVLAALRAVHTRHGRTAADWARVEKQVAIAEELELRQSIIDEQGRLFIAINLYAPGCLINAASLPATLTQSRNALP